MDLGHLVPVEIDISKREDIKELLYKHWPDTIEILRGLSSGIKMYTNKLSDDCLPDETVVVAVYNEGNVKFIYSFYTETVHVSRAASMLKSVIDSQDSSYQIFVDGIDELLYELRKTMGFQMLSSPAIRYIYTAENRDGEPLMKRPALPEGYKIDSIKFSDIDFVASKWEYDKFLRYLITNYPSVAIYDTSAEPAQPVSWVVSTGIGILFHLFTVEEHRGKGLGTIVIQEETRKILAKGLTPFCYIYKDNVKSQGLFKKCGYLQKGSSVSHTDLK